MRFAALFLCVIPLPAQSPLSLKDAIGQALAQNPVLAANRARVEAAAGRHVQAGLSPNPRVFLQSENTRFTTPSSFTFFRDTDTFAYASQVFESGGKRQRRMEFASSGVRLAELDQEAGSRHIAARVGFAYWNAVGAARSFELLEESARNFERIVTYHRDRVREGAMAGADLLRVELEQDRLRTLASNAQREAESSRLALFREMGLTQYPAVALSGSLTTLTSPVIPDLPQILDARPEIRGARQTVEQARGNVQLQQANAKPDPEVLFGYKRTAGYDTVIAGLQINLPIRNRNQGNIAVADADVRLAEASLRSLELQVKSEVESARRDYESRRQLLTIRFPEMLRRAEESLRISDAAYREGGTDILRLLDATRSRIEILILYNRTLTDYQQSVIALQTAAGILP